MYRALARMTGGVCETRSSLSVWEMFLQELPTLHNNLFTRYQACLRDERSHLQHRPKDALSYKRRNVATLLTIQWGSVYLCTRCIHLCK